MFDGKPDRKGTVFGAKFKEQEKNERVKIRAKRNARAPELVQYD
jgi:hypothetical protein